MCGGFSGQTCLGSVETYTPGDSNWTEIISMISPRSGVVTVVHNGLLWSLGGFNGEDRLRSTEYYDGKIWQKGPNMTRERSNFAGMLIITESMWSIPVIFSTAFRVNSKW